MDISHAVFLDRGVRGGQLGPFGVLRLVWANFAISERGRTVTQDGLRGHTVITPAEPLPRAAVAIRR